MLPLPWRSFRLKMGVLLCEAILEKLRRSVFSRSYRCMVLGTSESRLRLRKLHSSRARGLLFAALSCLVGLLPLV